MNFPFRILAAYSILAEKPMPVAIYVDINEVFLVRLNLAKLLFIIAGSPSSLSVTIFYSLPFFIHANTNATGFGYERYNKITNKDG